MASEVQKMRKKIAVQMKDKALNGQDSISLSNFLTEFKTVCDSTRIHEGAAV